MAKQQGDKSGASFTRMAGSYYLLVLNFSNSLWHREPKERGRGDPAAREALALSSSNGLDGLLRRFTPANEHLFVIAKEACRLWQSTKIFQMDGHVAALLAMTVLESSLLPIPNGSAFV